MSVTVFKNMCFNQGMHVSAAEVIELIREISNWKAARIDDVSGESLIYHIYANHILSDLLSICFTCIFIIIIIIILYLFVVQYPMYIYNTSSVD